MRSRTLRLLAKHTFLLALLLHLFFLIFLTYNWIVTPEAEPFPEQYIPSFAYEEKSSTAAFEQKTTKVAEKQEPTSRQGILKPVFDVKKTRFNELVDISSAKNSEPVHLIGDNKNTPQPLIVLLGKALTAQLIYPKTAIDLTVKGMSVIGFVLHPDGHVTDVRLLKTSQADVLDQAAVSAARQISPVRNVGQFINEPKPIVFGIIFGGH